MTDTKAPRAQLRNFGAAEFRYREWAYDLDETQSLDDATDPAFWCDIADQMMGHDKANTRGIGDIIKVRKRDTSQYMELLVIAIGKGFVRVAPIRAYDPKTVDVPANSPLATRWNPGKKCHEVQRVADKAVMATGFQTKPDAVAWITNHVKAMATAA